MQEQTSAVCSVVSALILTELLVTCYTLAAAFTASQRTPRRSHTQLRMLPLSVLRLCGDSASESGNCNAADATSGVILLMIHLSMIHLLVTHFLVIQTFLVLCHVLRALRSPCPRSSQSLFSLLSSSSCQQLYDLQGQLTSIRSPLQTHTNRSERYPPL